MPAAGGRVQRDSDDLFVQCRDSAPIFRRDARARDEHLRDLLSGAAAARRSTGRGDVATHSHRPRAGVDGRNGGNYFCRNLYFLKAAARAGLRSRQLGRCQLEPQVSRPRNVFVRGFGGVSRTRCSALSLQDDSPLRVQNNDAAPGCTLAAEARPRAARSGHSAWRQEEYRSGTLGMAWWWARLPAPPSSCAP